MEKSTNHTSTGIPTPDATTTNNVDNSGLLRYFTVVNKGKRKRDQTSPGNSNVQQPSNSTNNITLRNRFDPLTIDDDIAPRKSKPPPIYIREKSSAGLANKIKPILKHEYYLVDLKRGELFETKVQVSDETDYTVLAKWLESESLQFYSYQMKNQKGLRVVIKGIDHEVNPDDIKQDLEKMNFKVNWVSNILNRFKQPQPMFKVELMPDSNTLPKGKIHPIYEIKYVLQRKITVEEPYKRSTPIQCLNCQEFGHTKTYCRLKSVCVVCSGNHKSSDCEISKADATSKCCSNCGQNHTANYRGCPVYLAINRNNKSAREIRNPQAKTATLRTNPIQTHTAMHPVPQEPRPITQSYATSYADTLKYIPRTQNQNQIQTNDNNSNTNCDNISQMLMMLINNIQQLTNSMQQMQELQRQQLQLLSNLITKP